MTKLNSCLLITLISFNIWAKIEWIRLNKCVEWCLPIALSTVGGFHFYQYFQASKQAKVAKYLI